MSSLGCSVVGCTNNTRQIEKWKKLVCEIHEGQQKAVCGCEQPFYMYSFPGQVRFNDKRKDWVRILNRENPNKTSWIPKKHDRVCKL